MSLCHTMYGMLAVVIHLFLVDTVSGALLASSCKLLELFSQGLSLNSNQLQDSRGAEELMDLGLAFGQGWKGVGR